MVLIQEYRHTSTESLYAWTEDVFYLLMVRSNEQPDTKSRRIRERFSGEVLKIMTF